MSDLPQAQHWVSESVQWVGLAIEFAGTAVIVIGSGLSLLRYGRDLLRRSATAYKDLRTRLGRAILLGLELLVAADILRTVAFEPTLNRAIVLALIVLIRTFLSFSLEVEITGTLPWKKSESASVNPGAEMQKRG